MALKEFFMPYNPDGGFELGMEPDTASSESQPLFSIMALETLHQVAMLQQL
ncbi:MAG: hypothetical protein JXQ96_08740 [Cyclobacteriaceae bacterium]